MTGALQRRRCAIYTRKSTDEGLDQAFNSLEAQREACEAYVFSQSGEGWSCLDNRYDDGGWSGGNMERPALARLLSDIRQGQIDTVLVYKVDRLTRSLMDFARIVEIFDGQNISFVSVTQAFNTTSSMGRLTLNVLLSFAQFEREVTGERIRDKVAASRAKGMWMGGNLPLGYDLGERRLLINDDEAGTVRHIFKRYAALQSLPKLATELREQGIFSKRWTARGGRVHGGLPFSCGALSRILNNKLYCGIAVHKGKSYPGEHEAIIGTTEFDATQAILADNRIRLRTRKSRAATSPLAGKIHDGDGQPMGVSFSYGRGKVMYRYYLSPSLTPDGRARSSSNAVGIRIAAERVERTIIDALGCLVPAMVNPDELFALVSRLTVLDQKLLVELELERLPQKGESAPLLLLRAQTLDPKAQLVGSKLVFAIERPALRRGRASSGERAFAIAGRPAEFADLLQDAHRRLRAINASPFAPEHHPQMTVPNNEWGRRRLTLGLLAPDIQRAMLLDKVPQHLTPEWCRNQDGPVDWEEQRRLLGMSGAGGF